MSNDQGKYLRRNYLIRKGFQIRFSFLIFITTIVISIIAVWTTYVTTWNELTTQVQSKQFYEKIRMTNNINNEAQNAAMINSLIVVEFSEIFERVSIVLVMRLLVGSFLLFVLSIFASHKIAGPLYRMENAANSIKRGDLSVDLSKLRAGDELGDLAAALNGAILTLRVTMDRLRDAAGQLAGLMLQFSANKKKGKTEIEEFNKLSSQMEVVVNKLVTETGRFTTVKSKQEKQPDK
ncbi:MAG: methyl-accepting chemotaxis protein [Candidatus Omnitrophica bacterium]|nr:methyl-accepting chemotaxis protein [Candidatus Omnitrophota bacterium]